MPRQARLDIPGSLQFVSACGIGRSAIFRDDRDRMSFIAKLGSLVKETQTRCYAWSLLSGSFHLLLGIDAVPLSTVMRRLITGYATAFNHKYRRKGPVFYSRYRSTVCEKGPYFLDLVRHIHLGPLKAGVVRSLEELDRYPWTGHYALMDDGCPQQLQNTETAEGAMIGSAKAASIIPPPSATNHPLSFQVSHPASIVYRPSSGWQACKEVLEQFSADKKAARRKYRAFMRDGAGQRGAGAAPDSNGAPVVLGARALRSSTVAASGGQRTSQSPGFGGFADMTSDRRILGSREFVALMLKQAGEPAEPGIRRVSLEDLCERIRRRFEVDEEEMRSALKKKQAADAKAVFCYLAIRKAGYYGVEVGDYLHMQGYSASRAAERGRVILQDYGLDPSVFLQ